ncbi:DUF4113 domain-containing protein [Methylobacterium hispanicum]|uniref:DUF4113 domain-containing protein n=1 Tax=Methylobacterium hispanicum TaxID=270350 RepID=UPI0024B49D1C|nr:DUF4113 domain-containing protein [Methylobacterium hispanicum]
MEHEVRDAHAALHHAGQRTAGRGGLRLRDGQPNTCRNGPARKTVQQAEAEAIDACNQSFGRGAVMSAAATLERDRTWSTNSEMRSPRHTTRLDDLPAVAARRGPVTSAGRPPCGTAHRRASA